MLRTLLLAILIVAAAGVSLTASAETITRWSHIPAISLTRIGADHRFDTPDRLPMILAGLGLMGVIARRRYR